MAIGTETTFASLEGKVVELLASATATNSPPSGATAGLNVSLLSVHGYVPSEITILVYSTAGSGTMSVTCRLWGYALSMWFPLGIGGDGIKGTLNGGAAIGETAADKIRHAETVSLPGHFERLYLEIVAIGGTSTAITAQAVARRGV